MASSWARISSGAEIFKVDGAGHEQQALIDVRAGGGVVAERAFSRTFAKSLELAEPPKTLLKTVSAAWSGFPSTRLCASPGPAALAEVRALAENAGLFLHGVHPDIRPHVPADLAQGSWARGLRKGGAGSRPSPGAAVEEFYGRGGYELPVVLGERDTAHALRAGLRAQRAHRDGLVEAHISSTRRRTA